MSVMFVRWTVSHKKMCHRAITSSRLQLSNDSSICTSFRSLLSRPGVLSPRPRIGLVVVSRNVQMLLYVRRTPQYGYQYPCESQDSYNLYGNGVRRDRNEYDRRSETIENAKHEEEKTDAQG